MTFEGNRFVSVMFRFVRFGFVLAVACVISTAMMINSCVTVAHADFMLSGAVRETNRYEPFPALFAYQPYDDLTGNEWFFEAAKICKQAGIFGNGQKQFNADSIMTVEDCNGIMLRLREEYYGISAAEPLPDYQLSYTNAPDDLINRENFVDMITTVISTADLPIINEINEIPGSRFDDESDGASIGARILHLYRAGIIVGNELGYFSPFQPLTRAEAVAIAYRIVKPSERLSLDSEAFSSDPAIRIRRIDFDNNTLAIINGMNCYPAFTGDAFIVTVTSDDAYNEHAVYSLEGKLVAPFIELYDYGWEYYFSTQDGMTRYLDSDGVYQFYSTENGKVATVNKIREATLYNDGYAAVRFFGTEDTDIYVIDKNGIVVNTIVAESAYELRSIHPDEGVVLCWVDGKESIQDNYLPYDITSNVIINIETGKVINFEDSAWISDVGFYYGYTPAIKEVTGTGRILDKAVSQGGKEYDLVNTNGEWLGFNETGYDGCTGLSEKYILVRDGNQEKIVNFAFKEIDIDNRQISNLTFVRPYDSIVDYVATNILDRSSAVQRIVKDVDTGDVISIDSPINGLGYIYGNYADVKNTTNNDILLIIDVVGNALLSLPSGNDMFAPTSNRRGDGFVYKRNGEYYHFEYTKDLRSYAFR